MLDHFLDTYDRFYFIGIGGVSMSALAKLLRSYGKFVTGCDAVQNEYTEELEKCGIRVGDGESTEGLEECQIVVYTDAVKDNNLQLETARNAGKYIVSRAGLLYEISRRYRNVVAVAGCHGKTTCTAMLSHVMYAAGKEFTCHIGGRDRIFSNMFRRGDDYFISEACEYNKNFLSLKPQTAIILNSDADHLECYGNLEQLKISYLKFAENADRVIALYGDLPIGDGVTFGFDDRADYYAKSIRSEKGKYSFTAYEGQSELGKISLDVCGKHHVLNALAAIAAAREEGIPFAMIKVGLESFGGVERRFENIGSFNGADCIADYAHHPNEIRAAIKTAKQITEGELFVVFQPHTYSRTKSLFKDFVRTLASVRYLLVYKTFAAREYFDDAGSALTLSQALKRARYGEGKEDIVHFIGKAKKGDTVLFLGAGDIYYIAKRIASRT